MTSRMFVKWQRDLLNTFLKQADSNLAKDLKTMFCPPELSFICRYFMLRARIYLAI